MKNNLERILNDQGRKITWLAETVKVHRNTITRIMAGAAPHLDVAFRIAKALDLSIYDIWDPE